MSGRKEWVRMVENYLESNIGRARWRLRRLSGLNAEQNLSAAILDVVGELQSMAASYELVTTVSEAMASIGRATAAQWDTHIGEPE